MLPFEGRFPSSRCGNYILCSTRTDFADNFYSTGLSVGEIYQQRFIFTAQQFAEWLFTHYGVLRRCVINYFLKLRLGWQSLSFEWKAFPHCLAKIQSTESLFVRRLTRVLGGQGHEKSDRPPDTNHIMCLSFWATLISAQEKRPRGGHLGTYRTNGG